MPKRKLAPGEHFVAGTTAGLVSTVALFPLDTIKGEKLACVMPNLSQWFLEPALTDRRVVVPAPLLVRFQVDERTTLRAPQRLVAAFRSVVAKEGWRTLYQGLSAGMYGSGLSWGGYFFFYEKAKTRWVEQREEGVAAPNAAWHHMAAACEAGTIMVALTNPIWLVKTRMQLQVAQLASQVAAAGTTAAAGAGRPYSGMFNALVTIVREEGPLALYKGSVPALLLVSHGAVQFVVYEWLKGEAGRRL